MLIVDDDTRQPEKMTNTGWVTSWPSVSWHWGESPPDPLFPDEGHLSKYLGVCHIFRLSSIIINNQHPCTISKFKDFIRLTPTNSLLIIALSLMLNLMLNSSKTQLLSQTLMLTLTQKL
jgi:hypothetical protein